MRVLFMGTPDFACPTLEGLVKAGVTVIGVFTQADRPKGRGQVLTPPPVKQAALAHHLPVFQPAQLSHKAVGSVWASLNPDMVVVIAYGFILPPWILHGTSMGCINLHASLLPRHRGAAPINWAIIRGDKETGVTTMLMDEGMDTGPILMQERTPITPEDTAGSIYDRRDTGKGPSSRGGNRMKGQPWRRNLTGKSEGWIGARTLSPCGTSFGESIPVRVHLPFCTAG